MKTIHIILWSNQVPRYEQLKAKSKGISYTRQIRNESKEINLKKPLIISVIFIIIAAVIFTTFKKYSPMVDIAIKDFFSINHREALALESDGVSEDTDKMSFLNNIPLFNFFIKANTNETLSVMTYETNSKIEAALDTLTNDYNFTNSNIITRESLLPFFNNSGASNSIIYDSGYVDYGNNHASVLFRDENNNSNNNINNNIIDENSENSEEANENAEEETADKQQENIPETQQTEQTVTEPHAESEEDTEETESEEENEEVEEDDSEDYDYEEEVENDEIDDSEEPEEQQNPSDEFEEDDEEDTEATESEEETEDIVDTETITSIIDEEIQAEALTPQEDDIIEGEFTELDDTSNLESSIEEPSMELEESDSNMELPSLEDVSDNITETEETEMPSDEIPENEQNIDDKVSKDVDELIYSAEKQEIPSIDDIVENENSEDSLTEDDLNFIQDVNSPTTEDSLPVYPAESPNAATQEGPAFAAGDHVSHPKYGEGVVEKIIRYGNKALCSISFINVGRRLLDPAISEITKLD